MLVASSQGAPPRPAPAAPAPAAARRAGAAPAAPPPRAPEGKDIFRLQCVTDAQIRPDGHVVAYVRMSYDIMTDRARRSIWLVDTDTGAQPPLATGPGSSSSPRWSPDGKRLAYISSDGGRPQLFVRWMQTEQAARITDLTEMPEDLAWSPDGRNIGFVMMTPDEKSNLGSPPPRPEGASWAEPLTVITDVKYRADGAGYLRPGYSHAIVVSAEGGYPRQLTFGAFNEEGPVSWTPDGKNVLLSGNRSEGWQRDAVTTQIYQISIADGVVTALTSRVGPDKSPRVSTDGKKIAYLAFDDRFLGYQNVRVHVMDRDGRNERSITESLDRSVDAAEWASDGRSLSIQYTDKAVTRVARLTLDGHLQQLADGLAGAQLDRPYSGGQFSVSYNGIVAFTRRAPNQPPKQTKTRDAKVTRLTRLNDDLFAVKQLGKDEPQEVSSSVDKLPIGAWLVTPPQIDHA